MPLEIVFLEPQKWRPLKPYYRLHGNSELPHRSVFTTPPKFATPWTLLGEGKMSVIPRKLVSAQAALR